MSANNRRAELIKVVGAILTIVGVPLTLLEIIDYATERPVIALGIALITGVVVTGLAVHYEWIDITRALGAWLAFIVLASVIHLIWPKTMTVEGTIHDTAGNPVSYEEVLFFDCSYMRHETKTNGDGHYEFPGVPLGWYRVCVRDNEVEGQAKGILVRRVQQNITVPQILAEATLTPTPSPIPPPTDTPTSTPTNVPSSTPINPPTSTLTNTPTPTSTPSITPTPTTPRPTDTPTPTPSITPTPTTPRPTDTPTPTPSITPTHTNTPTSTPTDTPPPINTPTSSPTNTPTHTNTPTSMPTYTSTPTNMPTSTPTNTSTPTKPATPSPTPTNTPEAVVIWENGLNLRSGPGTEYDSIGSLHNGDILDIKGRIASNRWIQVVPGSSGTLGWVSALPKYVQINVDLEPIPIVEPPTPTATPVLVCDAVVNAPGGIVTLRSGPGDDYDSICTLPDGTTLDVLRRVYDKDNWIKVAVNPDSERVEGYVNIASGLIQVNVDLEDVPPIYEFGPVLNQPEQWVAPSIGDTLWFTWERFELKPDQCYSVRVVPDVGPESIPCIHIQVQNPVEPDRNPGEFLKLDCPRGAYYWSVVVATKLPEGSEHKWREDSEFSHKHYFGIGVPHPNTPREKLEEGELPFVP